MLGNIFFSEEGVFCGKYSLKIQKNNKSKVNRHIFSNFVCTTYILSIFAGGFLLKNFLL